MLPAFQTELPEQFGNAIMQSLPSQTIYTAEKFQILSYVKTAVQGKFLRHIPEMLACLCPGLAQIHPGHPQHAAACGQKTAQHAEGCGLSRSVRAEQAEKFPPAHAETGVVHRNKVSETAHQIAHLNYGFPIRDFFQRAFAPGKGGQRLFKRELLFCIPSLPEYDHETVLESGRNGRCFPSAAARGLFPSLRFREDFFF